MVRYTDGKIDKTAVTYSKHYTSVTW